MNITHTPAPWNTERKNDGQVEINLPGDGSIQILGYNTEANATLIAAAPELLEALEEALSQLIDPNRGPSGTKAAQEKARAAIAKAKG